jgi:hypothetical protein
MLSDVADAAPVVVAWPLGHAGSIGRYGTGPAGVDAMSRPVRAEARSTPLPLRLSPDERSQLNLAARVNHQTPSQFARDALASAAAECLEAPIRSTKP